MRPLLRTLPLVLAAALLGGCAAKVDKLVVKRVVARALAVPDVDQACQIGSALRSPLAAATRAGRPPHQAVLIAEFTAALCDEAAAFEHELRAAQALSDAVDLPAATRVAFARDARLAADRAHARSAARFLRAWEQGEAEFGELGTGACPRLRERDELPYMLTLVAGMQVVLQDSAAGSPLGVPKETILDVARAAACLDDAKWWYGPSAMQAAAWATIPGSAPEGVDPWDQLEAAAVGSDPTGIRVARALQVIIARNAGQEDRARAAIAAHAAAIAATPASAAYGLFDQYALNLSRHQSDLLWMKEEGHRTPVFGELPTAATAAPAADPFASDPFAADPFADPAAPPESEAPPETEPAAAPPEEP